MADINNFYGLISFLLAAGREGRAARGRGCRGEGRPGAVHRLRDEPGGVRQDLPGAHGAADGPRRERTIPVAALRERGWEGLSILSPHPDVIERLAERERRGLYVQLSYGRPFSALAGFARDRGLPTAAVQDTVFLDESDERLYPLLRAIDLNTTLERVPAEERRRDRAAHRALSPLSWSPRPWRASSPRCRRRWPTRRRSRGRRMPPASSARTSSFPAFDGLAEEETFRMLARLCEEGVQRRYGGMRPDIRERLDYELAIIREKGFASYFLVVRDIVQQCPRTCGRGSAASSIVSYLLGITHVDPLRYTLFFERFLNRGRKDPPDIDVDFPWDEREKTLKYVFEKYAGRAAMVANHVTFGPRSAIRDPAKALGLPEEEIGAAGARLPPGPVRGHPAVRPGGRGAHPRLPPQPRHALRRGGHHPGPITDYTHVQTSPLGYPVIAWEKDATEEAGLVKIDLLGNRSLAVLRDTLELVESEPRRAGWSGRASTRWRTPTRGTSSPAGKTLGVFYVESPATRQLLTKMRKGDYENLVIASSIIRPAANQYIRTFVKRLHGAPYQPLHPLIEKTLAETFGVMVYQEDVSRVAIDLAGFPIEEADRLRKILSKKDRDLKLPDFRERFFRGARARGVRGGDHREGLGHDPLLRRLLLLQGAQRLLRPGLLPRGVPEAVLPAGVHGLGHQQRRRLLRPADLRGRVPAHGLPHPAAGREQRAGGSTRWKRLRRRALGARRACASGLGPAQGRAAGARGGHRGRSASGAGRSRGFRDFLRRTSVPVRGHPRPHPVRRPGLRVGRVHAAAALLPLAEHGEGGGAGLPAARPAAHRGLPAAGQARRRGEDPRHRGLPPSPGALPPADRADRAAPRPCARSSAPPTSRRAGARRCGPPASS